MTGIWGSSSYWDRDGRNLITEWTHLDGEIRARNGNKGMQVRRTYTTGIPDSFEYSQAFPDYNKRISAMTINTPAYSNLADGTLDSKLRHYVNDVPTDHTIYLGFNHEPEVKGDPTLFAQGVARAAQVIFDTGKTNIIPTFCLMDWTFQSYSGRNPDNWNPGVYLSDPEKAGVVAGVDGYAMAAPYQRTPNWLFSHPWDVYAGWGFDRWAIYECGVNQESVGRKDWMRALETHVNNKGVEMVCWWHSQVYKDAPENRWYILFLDYDQQAEPDSLQVWADIIARNQDGSAPVVVIPPEELPPPPVVNPPTTGGGGNPIPVPSTPGVIIGGILQPTPLVYTEGVNAHDALRDPDSYTVYTGTSSIDIGFDFQGYTSCYPDNGVVGFSNAAGDIPFALTALAGDFLAPYWIETYRDQDSFPVGSHTAEIRYGNADIDGRSAFIVTWWDVGVAPGFPWDTTLTEYFFPDLADGADQRARFQVVMYDDNGWEFNYDKLPWDVAYDSRDVGDGTIDYPSSPYLTTPTPPALTTVTSVTSDYNWMTPRTGFRLPDGTFEMSESGFDASGKSLIPQLRVQFFYSGIPNSSYSRTVWEPDLGDSLKEFLLSHGGNSDVIGRYVWALAGDTPNLAGAFDARRRRFARGPTANTG